MRQPAAVLLAHAWRNDQFGQFFANSFLSTKKPNTRSAAGANSRTRPSASMVMMQSSAVSRMPRYSISSSPLGTGLLFLGRLDLIRSAPALRETNKFDAERAI